MLILVDGTSIFNACFFATMPKSYFAAKTRRERFRAMSRAMRAPTGEMVNGVYGMLALLFALVDRVQPSHLAVIWDASRDTFRRELYRGYKPKRVLSLPEVNRQVELMRRLLGELGVFQCDREGFEADDVMATLAERFAKEVEVCVYSRDLDLLQVVAPNVRFWLHDKEAAKRYAESFVRPLGPLPDSVFEYTEEAVERLVGVPPFLVPDLKALAGDRSVGLPGLAGVGEKSALRLVQAYGAVEEMYQLLEPLSYEDRMAEFKKHNLTATLLDKLFEGGDKGALCGKRAVLLSKRLAVLCRDVPLEAELDDMRLPRWSGLPAVFAKLGFKKLKLPRWERQQALFG